MSEITLEAIDEYRYRIRRNEALGMRTNVLVYSSPKLLPHIQKDQSLAQAMNIATLPGIVGSSLAMPDIHQGYGFPIGGVAATDLEGGVVSPGGVGFDINCGVRLLGQPVFVPGSMGTASWVLLGQQRAVEESFGSVCHGAGRLLSRTAVRKGKNIGEERRKLEEAGILVRSESRDGVLEELPEAYKDVDELIEVVHYAGLAKKVARLRPMGVIKG